MTLATGDITWSARHWNIGTGHDVDCTHATNVRVVGDRLAVSWNNTLRPPPHPTPKQVRTISAWGRPLPSRPHPPQSLSRRCWQRRTRCHRPPRGIRSNPHHSHGLRHRRKLVTSTVLLGPHPATRAYNAPKPTSPTAKPPQQPPPTPQPSKSRTFPSANPKANCSLSTTI